MRTILRTKAKLVNSDFRRHSYAVLDYAFLKDCEVLFLEAM